jgi:hypothetical protein
VGTRPPGSGRLRNQVKAPMNALIPIAMRRLRRDVLPPLMHLRGAGKALSFIESRIERKEAIGLPKVKRPECHERGPDEGKR